MDIRKLPILIRLGKKGLTKGMLNEMRDQLKKKHMLKCRFLKSYPFAKDRKTEAARIAYMLSAELLTIKGFVFTLQKKKTQVPSALPQDNHSNSTEKRA